MNVKRCDRCGAVYEADYGKNERGTSFVLLSDETVRLKSDMNGNRYFSFRYEGTRVEASDLCAGCAEDFKRWFDRR